MYILLAITFSFVSVDCVKNQTCPHIRIVGRDEWLSNRDLRVPRFKSLPIYRLFIHHTFTAPCVSFKQCSRRVRYIQYKHVHKLKWDDIGYNFLIGGDGNVYVGRGWDRKSRHTHLYNQDLAIAFIGHFNKFTISSIMLYASQKLIVCGVRKGKVASHYSVYGHRDVDHTDCPGDPLYKAIKKWPHFQKAEKSPLKFTSNQITTSNETYDSENIDYR